MEKFIVLSPNFTLKGTTEKQYLFDLCQQQRYQLEPDQYDLLSSLNGSKPIDTILEEYDKESQTVILNFLQRLQEIDAIQTYPNPLGHKKPATPLAREPHLAVAHFEFTNLCNLRCRHCYQEKYLNENKKDALTFDEITALALDFRTLNVEQVGISGGEPFFHPDLFKIIGAFEQNDVSVNSVLTNGILMTEEKLKVLKKFRSLPIIFVSLDSLNPEEFSAIRGLSKEKSAQAIRVIVNNIRTALDIGFPVMANTVVTRNNIAEFSKIYRFLRQLGVDGWRIALPKKTGSYIKNQELFNISLPPVFEAYFELLKQHLAYQNRDKEFRLQIEHFYREDVIREFRPQTLQDFACDYEGKRNSCCIKPNGDITPCPLMCDFPVGNLRERKLEDIWYSEKMIRFKDIMICDIPICSRCEFNYLCATGCRANAFFECHSLEEPDPYACFAARFFTERVIPHLEVNGIAHSPYLKLRPVS